MARIEPLTVMLDDRNFKAEYHWSPEASAHCWISIEDENGTELVCLWFPPESRSMAKHISACLNIVASPNPNERARPYAVPLAIDPIPPLAPETDPHGCTGR